MVVSDAANHRVYVFDAELRLVRRFGGRGSRSRQFKSPRHLAITPDNDVLVSDYGNHCVKARMRTSCSHACRPVVIANESVSKSVA